MASKKKRSSSGQALAEGAAMLVLFMLVSMALITLAAMVVGYAVHLQFQMKVAHAAESGARFGAESGEWLGMMRPDFDMNGQVGNAVNLSLQQMGMNTTASNPIVVATAPLVNSKRYVLVKITYNVPEFPLAGKYLPWLSTVTETACSPISDQSPPGATGMTTGYAGPPAPMSLIIPTYGWGNPVPPVAGTSPPSFVPNASCYPPTYGWGNPSGPAVLPGPAGIGVKYPHYRYNLFAPDNSLDCTE